MKSSLLFSSLVLALVSFVPSVCVARPMGGGCPDFAALAKQLSPSVVNISVEGTATPADDALRPPPAPGDQNKDDAPVLKSLGSGFIISEEGYVVTSNHVIDKSDRIIIRLLEDKTEYNAQVIGKDVKTDIALLKIDYPGKLKVAESGDSDALEVGDWVMAIGNQFQLGQTVTAGIVSAKSRRVPSGHSGPYDAFIQTDASINPGSSGGPLFNGEGKVVGINTAIFSPGRNQFGGAGFNIGIGFAVPMNIANRVVKQLREHGKVTRGLLGVLIQRVDTDLARMFSLKKPDGALVSDVMKGSPAEAAGFKRRDVIVTFNGKPVRDHDDLPLMVADTTIGESVKVGIFRDGKPQEVSVVIGELRDDQTKRIIPQVNIKPDASGVVGEEVNEELARILGLSETSGVLVAGVEPGSIAERAGLTKGDVIQEFNNEQVKNLDHYVNLVSQAKTKAGNMLVLVRRDEGSRFVVFKFEK